MCSVRSILSVHDSVTLNIIYGNLNPPQQKRRITNNEGVFMSKESYEEGKDDGEEGGFLTDLGMSIGQWAIEDDDYTEGYWDGSKNRN